MQVVQGTFGVFHQFELAHQLMRFNYLRRIYTTWPWARVKREGVPRALVSTFPFVHTTDHLLSGKSYYPRALANKMKLWNSLSFDRWTYTVIPTCDVFVGLSGTGLLTGPLVQRRGGKFVCDRGSTHHRFQTETIRAEYSRWGLPFREDAAFEVDRDEQLYDIADAISVPSTVVRRSFLSKGVAPEKVKVIPYGVRLNNFKKTEDVPNSVFEVLFVGQVSLRKGIPYLLQAFERVNHPRKHLTIVGSMQDHMLPLLRTLPTENVTFVGSVPQVEVSRYMSRSHVLVLPSIEEGLALVLAQALACECPVIATEATGAEDLFTDGVEGFIVPDRDVDALTSRMQQLAEDPDLRKNMAGSSLSRVRTLGGWDNYGDKWATLLQEIAGNSKPATS